ncbi:hypothetical protein QEN58_05925 [Halomonas alkaliantarctica]|uniref:Uncharacterized protein n=1 Tax=Halomonas alkaliantarctica TaxID=232346 RepID=A0ABY8LQ96_9GAMM|nr:hypothetical protein [Halomonas alkaliantarctica]WGI26595.1 hypothetical protein QEN58_05925 [Halomonas alkaliantarctica]
MNIFSNDAQMKLVPVECIFSDETSEFELEMFIKGNRRIQKVKIKLAEHGVPVGILQAIVLAAAHGLSFEADNIDMFRKNIYPLSTSHAGDFIRYVFALEHATEMALDDLDLTPEELFKLLFEHFCPRDHFELQVCGIHPIDLLSKEAWDEGEWQLLPIPLAS